MFLVTCTAVVAGTAYGQPAFEVTSVRVTGRSSGEKSRRENIQFDPASLTMRSISLKAAIRWAYHVMPYQVSGPDWLDTERYDIAARTAAPAREEQLRLMLQTLLADRFKLQLHRQTRELSAYVLSVGKNGPKFHESGSEGEFDVKPDPGRMSVTVRRAPVSQLVEILSNVLHTPVVDLTELKGRYDVTINAAKYAAELTPKAAGEAPADLAALILTAVQEELGLKLESRKVPLDLLIIDHVEKAPTEN